MTIPTVEGWGFKAKEIVRIKSLRWESARYVLGKVMGPSEVDRVSKGQMGRR
jgi:hypothetical protein